MRSTFQYIYMMLHRDSKKRGWIILAIAVVGFAMVACGGCAIWFFAGNPNPISSDTFARINSGMSLEDVQDLLGTPTHSEFILAGPFERVWVGRDATIRIEFDKQFRVINKLIYDRSFKDQLREWLGG
jgi:hypothetical protein